MATKKKRSKNRGYKIPGQSSASDPNTTAKSPSASFPTGDAATNSLVPSSASPSTPPTTTRLIPSAPPQPTSLLPSFPSQITPTKPLPSSPSLSIKETDQESISCTSDSDATPERAGPSTAPSAPVASTRTRIFMGFMDELTSRFTSAFSGAKSAVQIVKGENSALSHKMAVTLFDCELEQMETVLECLLVLVENMKGDAELKAELAGLAEVGVTELLLSEIIERLESSGFWGGSKGQGGGPDGGTGEGDGEGGGVGV